MKTFVFAVWLSIFWPAILMLVLVVWSLELCLTLQMVAIRRVADLADSLGCIDTDIGVWAEFYEVE